MNGRSGHLSANFRAFRDGLLAHREFAAGHFDDVPVVPPLDREDARFPVRELDDPMGDPALIRPKAGEVRRGLHGPVAADVTALSTVVGQGLTLLWRARRAASWRLSVLWQQTQRVCRFDSTVIPPWQTGMM
jgi:hypothetical protein